MKNFIFERLRTTQIFNFVIKRLKVCTQKLNQKFDVYIYFLSVNRKSLVF